MHQVSVCTVRKSKNTEKKGPLRLAAWGPGKNHSGFFLSPASSTVKMGMPFLPHRGHWEAKMRQFVGKDVEGKEGLAVKQTS